ncbi:MAG: glutathionylspermidine synthase family protein, partial [Verrucomicrobia bacterium]|nr:glutathionylspermidine synthase family protein [Verrucomicrobiota bacterium]
ADQFNSIHERLIEAWKRRGGGLVHFVSVRDHDEDGMTVTYLRDTCEQAGLSTKWLAVEDIGWDAKAKRFVDNELSVIDNCFKLYPWEWMWAEDYSQHLETAPTTFLEPAWKMLEQQGDLSRPLGTLSGSPEPAASLRSAKMH